MNAQSVGVQALYNRSIITTLSRHMERGGFQRGAGLYWLMGVFHVGTNWHFLREWACCW